MADDKQYEGKPFLYQSKGLDARATPDRVPEGFYINNLNVFEREEGAVSSRYGTQIINRDPDAAGHGVNYGFPAPVTSLAYFSFQSSAWRYAGTSDGRLYRRAGILQGPYSQIYSGLSGQPFSSLVTACYETSQPYLFIYDEAVSIKDSGEGFPVLTGIDPPTRTANVLPYSPLLTLIDNFAEGNSYTTSGFDASEPWAWASITGIGGTAGQTVTDFPQFLGAAASYEITGGATTATQTGIGVTTNSSIYSGFPNVAVSPATTVTVTIGPAGTGWTVSIPSPALGNSVTIEVQYSIDGGATWTIPYAQIFTNSQTVTGQVISLPITGLSNLDQLQLQAFVLAQNNTGVSPVSVTFDLGDSANAIVAAVPSSGYFGDVCNGILSILSDADPVSVPIASVVTSDFGSDGLYHALTITTTTNHNLPNGATVGVYATTNDLVDGFYPASIESATVLTVPYTSATYLSATGGFLWTVSGGASTCVLSNFYSTPYPTQFSAWGFYAQVPTSTTTFPVGCWGGLVDTNSTATVGVTADFDLSQANQVTDFDLIVLTLQVSAPANIASIALQFDVNNSGYTSSYYTATISPAYYQGSIAGQLSAYESTTNQILADTIGILTGDQPTGSTTAQLSPSNFSTGASAWIAVYIPRGNFLPVGNAGQPSLDWSNITGWQLVIETTAEVVTGDGSSTVSANGLYLQWGYGPSSFAGVGYDWRYTYYNANTGTESSPSPEQQFNSQFGYLPSLTPPFYLRQAAQVTVYASTDPQVTHIRFYRRGGEYASNWFLDGQIPNVGIAHGSNIGQVQYKDVIGDASLAQAQPLALDNDPPVTSSLVTPIQTTLAAPTAGPLTGQSYYGTFAPQRITTVDSSAIFVENQIVAVGNADNLELTTVVSTAFSSPGSFQAILRLQHNAGEQVSATSVPRQPCSLAALSNQGGVTQAWLAGDPNNPHYLYFSKPGLPENFSPANYIAVSSPSDPIMLVVNWRGTIVVATTQTWYVIVGGAQPYAQPTGAAHGAASSAYAQVEGRIIFLSQDGEREFSGSDGAYLTLPVEWMFRNAPPSIIVPRVSDYASTTMVQYQNQTYLAFQSASDSARYRLRYDDQYRRFGYDDVPATAMLWEQQTNALVVGRAISATSYGVVQDWVGDYDDGGWNAAGTALTVTPINLTIQTPYRDLGRPHNPKQWNMLEGDYNTQNQPIQTSLFFKGEEDFSIALPAQNLGAQRSKYQYKITATQSASDPLAAGIEAYSMSIQHQMAVTVAPTLYQENIYAVALADERTSFDTYWQKMGNDMLGILPKNFYFDYTTSTQLTVSLYADGSPLPYYVDNFTLIPQTDRAVVRVEGPTRKGRLWRMIVTSAENSSFQLWAPVKCETKPSLQDGSGYEQAQFRVSE